MIHFDPIELESPADLAEPLPEVTAPEQPTEPIDPPAEADVTSSESTIGEIRFNKKTKLPIHVTGAIYQQ